MREGLPKIQLCESQGGAVDRRGCLPISATDVSQRVRQKIPTRPRPIKGVKGASHLHTVKKNWGARKDGKAWGTASGRGDEWQARRRHKETKPRWPMSCQRWRGGRRVTSPCCPVSGSSPTHSTGGLLGETGASEVILGEKLHRVTRMSVRLIPNPSKGASLGESI